MNTTRKGALWISLALAAGCGADDGPDSTTVVATATDGADTGGADSSATSPTTTAGSTASTTNTNTGPVDTGSADSAETTPPDTGSAEGPVDTGSESGGGDGGALDDCLMMAADACEECACNNCLAELMACQADPGCVAIRMCAQENDCTGIECLGPCGEVINANGGPLGPSVGLASTLSDCYTGACPDC